MEVVLNLKKWNVKTKIYKNRFYCSLFRSKKNRKKKLLMEKIIKILIDLLSNMRGKYLENLENF